jgi:hypothetical protein
MTRGTTTLEPVAERLASLGLDQAASSLPELVEEATREKLAPVAFLDRILTRQLEHQDERRVTTMLKLPGPPPGKTLEAATGASSRGWTGARSRRWRPATSCARR